MSDKNGIEELKNAYEAGKTLQYQKENGEWVDFSKNTVCDDFKFQEHLNYRIKPKCKWTAPNGPEYECKPSLICGDCEYNTFNPQAIKYDGDEYEAYKDGVKYKSTDGKTWISDSMCTEVHLTRRKPCEYIKGILNAYGAEHLIDLPKSMRLLVLQSLEEIIVNE